MPMQNIIHFFILIKTHIEDARYNHLIEAVVTRIHNITRSL